MGETRTVYVTRITENLHDDITEVYEGLMDGEDKEAMTKIDATISKLRHLKSNLVIKEN